MNAMMGISLCRIGEEVALAPYACLKDDRDLWYDIITEMKEGIRCSLGKTIFYFT